jgi:anti-sigma factor RsiW
MIQPNDHVLEHVDACLHGLLNDADAAAVRKHCDECPICRVAWDEAQKRFDALAALPAVETSSELIERTERRLEQAATRRRRSLPVRWFERRSKMQKLAVVAAVLAAMIGSLHVYYLRLSASPFDLRVLGQEQLLSGSETSLRVTVFNQSSQALMAGVPVEVDLSRLATKEFVHLASFQTDENGTGSPRFHLPDWNDGSCQLSVSARIGFSREVINRSVALRRSWQVMTSTDKPVYQPGEPIRMRTLALRRPDLKPVADGEVTFTVADAKGNVIFRRRDVTSRYGIASADCPLADEIVQGTYRIDCRVGDTTSATAVEVKKHVLPKFKIVLDADRPFYQPGEMVKGSVQADYFFGKPVGNATVRVDLAPESSGGAAVDPLTLRTNLAGRAEFSLQIPQSTIRPQQEGDDASIGLRATVVDSAGQTESRTISRVVSRNPLRIEVVPESGKLVPGISNVVYLMTTYADGRPAATRIVVSGFEKEVVTSEAGIGTLEFTPKDSNRQLSWIVRASDKQGLSGFKDATLPISTWSDNFLVRTDRAIYTGGQTMHVAATGRGDEPVFIDLLKDGQTVVTDAIAMSNGKGEYAFDLPPDLFGTVELCAYRFRREGRPWKKTRVLYVRQANSLQIQATAEHKEYRPGQKAAVHLQLVDSAGRPTPGAISLTAVDEAVYSVLNQISPDEQSAFTLDEKLLKPVHALRTWSPVAAEPTEDRIRFEQALFSRTADSSPGTPEFDSFGVTRLESSGVHSLAASTYPEKAAHAQSRQIAGLDFVYRLWTIGAIFLGCGLLAYVYFVLLADLPGLRAVAIGSATFVLLLMVAFWLGSHGENLSATRFAMRWESGTGEGQMALAKKDRETKSTTTLAPAAEFDFAQDATVNPSYKSLNTAPVASKTTVTPPRVRQWFPETLLWRPEIITDDRGEAHVDVDLADSITTWRLTASAVSAEGQLGSSQSAVRVFQPFFVDVNLPVALLRGDEVGVPVVVHNHLDKPQTVALTVDNTTWFERLGPAQQSVTLGPREVKSVTYRLRVRKIGEYHLQVAAFGSGVADAVKRPITVVPDGRRVERVVNGTLGQPKAIDIERPAEAIDGSRRTILKIYPSSFSQLVEGLDSIFQMPYGCFEQTSSTTYPNLLALDYLRRTKTSAPAIEAKAQQYLHLGYQRLLSFEVPGGGFEWFGHDPANRVLTAYGLMEFEEMARVHEVDPQVIARTQHWLLSQQAADGSWAPESHGLEGDPTRGQGDDARLRTTAYIAWSVFKRGLVPEQATLSLHYLLGHSPNSIDDPYTLALVANALLAIDASGANAAPYLDRLEAIRRESNHGARIWWQQRPSRYTMFYGGGRSGDVETTALATLAFLAANRGPDAVRGALAWIIEQKAGAGNWGSTQATVLALKALIDGTGKPLGEGARRIQLSLEGKPLPEIVIPADQSEVVRQIDLTNRLGTARQTLQLTDASGTAAGFQVVSSYYTPDTSSQPHAGDLAVNVNYDRQKLPLNGTLTATATVENKSERTAPMILVELPIPAGFALDTESFSKLVESGAIAKFQIGARTATIYFRGIKDKSVVTLQYRMQATMPAILTVPPAVAYEYYNAEKRATSQPVQIVVDVAG